MQPKTRKAVTPEIGIRHLPLDELFGMFEGNEQGLSMESAAWHLRQTKVTEHWISPETTDLQRIKVSNVSFCEDADHRS